MFLISHAIGADTAADPKDAEASEEDNPADSDGDGGLGIPLRRYVLFLVTSLCRSVSNCSHHT